MDGIHLNRLLKELGVGSDQKVVVAALETRAEDRVEGKWESIADELLRELPLRPVQLQEFEQSAERIGRVVHEEGGCQQVPVEQVDLNGEQ